MAEKSQKKLQNQIISEMETNLVRAYQVINQQQEQIQRLQEQLSQNQNNSSQQKSTVIQQKYHSPTENINSPRVKRKSLHHLGQKNLSKSKTNSLKLSKLQFAGLVAVVTILMTLVSLALMRRQNPSSLPSRVAPLKTLTKQQKSNVSEPNLPNSQYPKTISKSQESLESVTALPTVPQTTSPTEILPPVWQEQQNLLPAYNVKTAPNFKKSKSLQTIIDKVVTLATAKGLPKQALSITLIDVKTGEYAEYQQEKPRFPASIVKMFWMVNLYAQI